MYSIEFERQKLILFELFELLTTRLLSKGELKLFHPQRVNSPMLN